MASATVPSAMRSCHLATGSCGDQSGFALIAFLDNLEEVEALLIGERMRSEVVENEQLNADELVDDAGKGAIEAGEREILEHARHPYIEHGMTEPGRLPSEGTGQP